MEGKFVFKRLIIIFILLLAASFSELCAQIKTLPKRYNPVIIKGGQLPIDSLKFQEWSAYSFNSQSLSWFPLPFQFDDLDGNGELFKENDEVLDNNDELLFMSNDALDQAGENLWLDSQVTGDPVRIEIEMIDPQYPDSKAWIYLYKNIVNPPVASGYFDYIPASDNSPADTIQTLSYKLGHNNKGWTDFVSLSFDWQKDLIDRVKFHIDGGGGFFPLIFLTEDTLSFATQEFIVNPIRSFQKVKTKIKLHVPPFPPIDKEDNFYFSFFPYSTEIGAGFSLDQGTKSLLAILKIYNIRLSVDLNPNINGMRFSSVLNGSGFPVDGIPDNPNVLLPEAGLSWVMASGDNGTIAAFFDFPVIQGSAGNFIYYRDDNNGGTNEGSPDSGDNISFGDMGLWIPGSALVPEESSLYISFNTYYINEKNKDPVFGEQLFREIQNPLNINATLQSRPTAVFSEPDYLPENFTLEDVYPNPFYTQKGTATFKFFQNIPERTTILTIFDIHGRIVKRLAGAIFNRNNASFEYQWNGRSESDLLLPSGIYFYRLNDGKMSITRKMLLIH